MKIGYDGKRAMRNLTGLGNYSRLVVEAVARHCPDCRCVLYTPDIRENTRMETLLSLPNVNLRLPQGNGIMAHGSAWRTLGITSQLRKEKIDLYHGLSNELPLNIKGSGIPSVVTMHDLIFRRMPGCYTLPDRFLYNLKYGMSCRIANRIIAVSKRTKDDIVEIYGVDPDKIDVVYQGCAEVFRHTATRNTLAMVREKHRLPTRYIVQVGTIEKRKNLELTVRALSALPSDVHLVAVGRDRGYLEHVRRIASQVGVADRLHVLDSVTMAELPAIYQQAAAVAYPSRYEGFGIPVLEGLESGRPVVAATGSCLEEAGGDAAFYVNPDSAREMAAALAAAMTEGPALVSRIALGKRHASRFNNADIAARIEAVYDRTLSARG